MLILLNCPTGQAGENKNKQKEKKKKETPDGLFRTNSTQTIFD